MELQLQNIFKGVATPDNLEGSCNSIEFSMELQLQTAVTRVGPELQLQTAVTGVGLELQLRTAVTGVATLE